MSTESTMPAWELVRKLLAEKISGRTWVPRPSPQGLRLVRDRFEELAVFEPMRPVALELESHGVVTQTKLPEGPIDFALVVPTRQRVESLGLIAHALKHLTPSGELLFVCGNDQGARGYLTHLKELAEVEAESGNKCRYLRLRAADLKAPELLEKWISDAAATKVDAYHTEPGIFGWNKIDRGSELLALSLPKLLGVGADLGSGYGYLAHSIKTKSPDVHVHLLEADARALACSKTNLEGFPATEFHWCDVVAEPKRLPQRLDWVVTNPPFHTGNKTDPDLGRAFIEAAVKMLKSYGRLYLVANKFLAYEDLLKENFSSVERVADVDGFKVIHAKR